MYKTIISVAELKAFQSDKVLSQNLIIFDCSFDLADPTKGITQYKDSHIPGALYANLDQHLSAHNLEDAINGGRHPLPKREIFAKWLSKMGVTAESQVVVYDRQGNNFCGRLWWMLKWCGHDNVAVLDGCLYAWLKSSNQSSSGEPTFTNASQFELKKSLVPMLSIDELKAKLSSNLDKPVSLIDARATPRFNGEIEPLDPIAGHIPGALNRPFNSNLNSDGFFKTKEVLKKEFEELLGNKDPQSAVHQCGSGVSAVPNLIAMHIAGFGYTSLYPGSWSEWSRVPGAPAERKIASN